MTKAYLSLESDLSISPTPESRLCKQNKEINLNRGKTKSTDICSKMVGISVKSCNVGH